jgi:hypothetical protein
MARWRSQFPVDRAPQSACHRPQFVKHKYSPHSILLKYRVKTRHITSVMLHESVCICPLASVEGIYKTRFDEVSQSWLERFLKHRIGDKRILRLIRKWLKAGVLEDGIVMVSDKGQVRARSSRPCLPMSTCTMPLICGPSAGDGARPRAT